MSKKLHAESRKEMGHEDIPLGKSIRSYRKKKGLTGVALCKRAGDLDPKTLTAVEMGRIKNPSIKTLLSISRGLGVMVADLFRQAEVGMDCNLYVGTQKGAFQMSFPGPGLKVISFTPFIKDFFCGKLIFSAKSKISENLLKHPNPLFLLILIGRFELEIEGQNKISLKEGENIFFNGMLKHSLHNMLHRESVLLMVTAPSFL